MSIATGPLSMPRGRPERRSTPTGRAGHPRERLSERPIFELGSGGSYVIKVDRSDDVVVWGLHPSPVEGRRRPDLERERGRLASVSRAADRERTLRALALSLTGVVGVAVSGLLACLGLGAFRPTDIYLLGSTLVAPPTGILTVVVWRLTRG
jgi:hypothetical protein